MRQGYLRRFDLEHTFRFFKQQLGWTTPRLRDPAAADRWTWLTIAAHTQLRLARGLTGDLRYPWERPATPERLTLPGSAGGFATSGRRPLSRPVHQNPPDPAQAVRPAPPTDDQPPATTSARPPNEPPASNNTTKRQPPRVKRQAETPAPRVNS